MECNFQTVETVPEHVVKRQIKSLGNQLVEMQKIYEKLIGKLVNLKSCMKTSKTKLKVLKKDLVLNTASVQYIYSQFTETVLHEVSLIKNPNTALVDLSSKFMQVVSHNDPSWKSFKAVMKNSTMVQKLISSIDIEKISDDVVKILIPIWEKKKDAKLKLKKYCKGVLMILEWICLIVDYKLKKKSIESFMQEHKE